MTSVQVSSNTSSLGQDVAIRQFHLQADEPPILGGDDAGPAPFEWVLAGLGACKAITLKMYAKRKAWALEQVVVNLNYAKVEEHHQIDVQLTLVGDLSPEQRQRLLDIADRCPVHKLLVSDVSIQTQLAAANSAPS
jgi:putative redox protein